MGVDEESAVDAPYTLYGKRWMILFQFSAQTFSNAFMWTCMLPLTKNLRDYYDVSDFWAQSTSSVFFVSMALLFVPAAQQLDAHGLARGTWIGSLLTSIGALVRLGGASSDGFVWLLVGTGIASCGQPFLLQGPTKLASHWFGEHERALATAIGALANSLGQLVGFAVAPVFIPPNNHMWMLLVCGACMCVVCTLLMVGFRSDPPTPPSATAGHTDDTPIRVSLLRCLRNPSFVVLWISFGIGVAVFNVFATSLSDGLTSLGYSDATAGALGFCFLFCGIVGSIGTSIVLDRTRAYKRLMVGCASVAVGCFVWFTVALRRDNAIMIFAAGAMLGTAVIGVVPVALELGVECTYPVPEATSTGLLFVLGNALAVPLLVVSDAMKRPHDTEHGSMRDSLWMLAGCFAVTWLIMCSWRGEYRRLRVERGESTGEQPLLTE